MSSSLLDKPEREGGRDKRERERCGKGREIGSAANAKI